MTTSSNPDAILKDVVAYVDVWSRNKTENYSKSFIQYLRDMGAEVTKGFNKRVTHVVFQHGHQATWNKAKKTGVRLVSVLWVVSCKDDALHADEELYPALNDEDNPALKRRHRSMTPKDILMHTPENDKRMKKKLDKRMKELTKSPPFYVSPFNIDEENGMFYSPLLKWSDTMAQRLQEMRKEREDLSPSASQMAESRLSPKLKSSLENTPSHSFSQLKLDTDSDEPYVGAQPCSKKKDGKNQQEDTGDNCPGKSLHKNDQSLSPCSDVSRSRSLDPIPFPDLSDEEGTKRGKHPRVIKIKRAGVKKGISSESPDGRKSVPAVFTFCEAVPGNSLRRSSRNNKAKGIPSVSKKHTAQSLSLSKSPSNTDDCNGSAFPSARSFALSSDSVNASSCPEEVDGAFEDYFSPLNTKALRGPRMPLLHSSPSETTAQMLFEPIPERKRGKTETTGPMLARNKRRKTLVW